MTYKHILLFFFSLIIWITKTKAQLNVTAIAQKADCAANGQINVTVTGGSGDYTYRLSGPCAASIPPQQTNVFDFLNPCIYTVEVVDRQTNANGKMEVEVEGDYQEMVLTVEQAESCGQRLIVEGGRGPYRYSFSPDGVSGPYQENQPPGSNFFNNLSGSDIHLRVEDACNIRQAIPSSALVNTIRDIIYSTTAEGGVSLEVAGGGEPFSFRMFNAEDTLILPDSFISWDDILCDGFLEVKDSCSSFVKPIDYRPFAELLCVNFSAGSAEVAPLQGTSPYTFIVYTEDTSFTSTTGIFDALPINAGSYEFYIEDACGKQEHFDSQTRLRIDADESDLGCTDDVLRFSLLRECGGGLLPPARVICKNCIPEDTVVVRSMTEEFEWSGFQAGSWDILIENDCGDSTRCRDELILELVPACDSISANIVDLFTCDNGTRSRRVITGDDASFVLLDENGRVLANNKTGVFENLAKGEYEMLAVLPNCDTLRNTVTLDTISVINPYLETWVDYDAPNGICQLFYQVNIEKEQGPFIVTGGPNNDYYEILNNFREDNCRFYGLRLEPGTYQVTSMTFCGVKMLELPQPSYDFTVNLVDNCPNDAKVLANGVRTIEEWVSFYEPFNLNIQNLFPDYFLESSVGTSREETGFTFRSLTAGTHEFLLYPLEEYGCAVDTVRLEIPDYEPVAISIAGDVVCDNFTTSDLSIQITGGKAPYELRRLDCGNNQELQNIPLDSAEIYTERGISLGGYCYAVSDVCQISADFQAKVRLFSDSIRIAYSCDEMLRLTVDSLPVSYQWRNSLGEILGDRFALDVPASSEEETYIVEVGLPECVVERRVTIPPREIIPRVDISYDRNSPVLCRGENITLTANTDEGNLIAWSQGADSTSIFITSANTYSVTATNDLGCTASAELEVVLIEPPVPQISGTPGFCLGQSANLTLAEPYSEQSWSTGENTESVEVSQVGWISVLVADEYGCTGRDSIEIVEWPLPEPSLSADTLICPGAETRLMLTESYAEYLWSDNSLTPDVDLPAGTHRVTVTDDNGCQESAEITILEKPQIYVQFQSDTTVCAGDSVQLSLSFTQPWYEAEFSVLTLSGERLNLQSTGDTTFRALFNATTTLSLADINMPAYGCPLIPQGTPQINVNQVSLQWREEAISCPDGENGGLEVFANSLYPTYTYEWSDGQTDKKRLNLTEGVYALTVVDGLGCSATDSFLLQAPLPIRPSLAMFPPLCRNIDDGMIAIDAVQGGTPPFTWRLNNLDQGRAPGEVGDLPPDTYTISFLDKNNCPWDTSLVFLLPPPLSLELGEDRTITIGETVRIEPLTNAADILDWQWRAAPDVAIDSSLVLEARPFEKTNFTLTVRNDYGCVLQDEISVFVDKEFLIGAPNAFSPDGDGLNDRFLLFGKTSNIERIESFQIFDRWGNKVFEASDLELNNETAGWDGRYKNQLLNTGVYIWIAKVIRVDQETSLLSGDVVLIRD